MCMLLFEEYYSDFCVSFQIAPKPAKLKLPCEQKESSQLPNELFNNCKKKRPACVCVLSSPSRGVASSLPVHQPAWQHN